MMKLCCRDITSSTSTQN